MRQSSRLLVSQGILRLPRRSKRGLPGAMRLLLINEGTGGVGQKIPFLSALC